MGRYSMVKVRFFSLIIILVSVSISLGFTSCTKKEHPKRYVIAVINPNPQLNDVVEGFKNKMNEYGFVQGENTTYVTINNLRDVDPALPEFTQKKVDLMFTLTTPATMKAKKVMEWTGIPVVFGTSYDPVKGGIVKRLAYQAEDITGVKVGGSTQKALEWLLKIAPKVKRIFVPVKIDTEAAPLSLGELKEAAAKFHIDLVISYVDTPEELKAALAAMPQDVDAIFIVNSIFIVSNVKTVVETSIRRKLPTAGGVGLYDRGVIISYSQDGGRSGAQAARLVHKILEGIPASSLPIEQADFYLGINLKTADAIDLKIPGDVLRAADFIAR
jgi:putative ABC transport system substrate-binding protein